MTVTTTADAQARQAREEQEALGAVTAQMGVVRAAMLVLHGELGDLKMLTVALDAIITNVDELGKLYEAPATTRSALDADSRVATLIDDMAGAALRHSRTALGLHRPGVLELAAVAQVQEEKALNDRLASQHW